MTGKRTLFAPVLTRLGALVRNDQLILSFLALAVGSVAGVAVIGFREAIVFFQFTAFGTNTEHLYAEAMKLPWWRIVLAPTLGGLAVGILAHRFLPGRRPHGVADVIESSALQGGRMSGSTGLRAALVNAASIGFGASVGREGPAVHLGASLGGAIAKRLHLSRTFARTLLGCGVAAAVAGSFNAPIAGALFASEVVIGHYALKAFAPIVIASVIGTMISRAYFGDFPAFMLAEHDPVSLLEFPAIIGLGLLSGLMAAVFVRGSLWIGRKAARSPLPPWSRPAFGGLAVGLIATVYPHVLGVGYATMDTVLTGFFPMSLLLALLIAKMAASMISLGLGFGGGVFSPSLVIGAVLGALYGAAVTMIAPGLSSGVEGYAVIGMGAMAAAVLGAPISTTLIVFEMTGDYTMTIAVMVAVVISSLVTSQIGGGSFFALQLKDRGLDLHEGFESALLRSLEVGRALTFVGEPATRDVALPDLREMLQKSEGGELFVVDDDGALFGTITLADMSDAAFDSDMDDLIKAGDVARTAPPVLCKTDNLEAAIKLMRETGEHHIAVVEDRDSMLFLGCVFERDVLAAYNRALLERRREEYDH